MKIYFAGSITGGRDDVNVYEQIIPILKNYGQVLTEHVGNKNMDHMGEHQTAPEAVYSRDVAWVDESDFFIAEVTKPSLGVGYELGYAESKGKKILCLYRETEGRRLSSMISGNKNFQTVIYKDISELLEIFNNFLK
jgi:2'-deoxynucleoside 5'-phosphate N-hydrolase